MLLGIVMLLAGGALQAAPPPAEKQQLLWEHLRAAVAHDPGYSAAWKLLGRANAPMPAW
jgi:cytochrome c-type biogenesis protein CcmH/NrfG